MLMDAVEERCDRKEVTSSAALVTRRRRFTALEPPLQGKSTVVGRNVVMCLLFEILRQGVNALSRDGVTRDQSFACLHMEGLGWMGCASNAARGLGRGIMCT